MSLTLSRTLWRYRGFILGSVKREFQARYRNSLLGATWTVLQPLAMITVYTVVFSELMRTRLPGMDSPYAYSIFLCAGLLTWGLLPHAVGPYRGPGSTSGFEDPHFALAFARIENHYFVHGAWLEEGQLLRDAGRLRAIPGTIVHGRYDMPCSVRTAYELHKAWPEADFQLIEGAGHAYSEPGILDGLIRATDAYAGR